MKRILMFFSFIILANVSYAQENVLENSPVGYWQTIDDVTGKPKAIVQIKKLANQTLVGQVLKIYPRPGYDENAVCKACEGSKHNKRVVGMQILESLQQKNNKSWINGKILDPNNGKIYNCNIQLIENNQKLQVRGYLGLPLFGRSQTWVRVENQG